MCAAAAMSQIVYNTAASQVGFFGGLWWEVGPEGVRLGGGLRRDSLMKDLLRGIRLWGVSRGSLAR